MKRDVRESLVALGAVTFWVCFTIVFLRLAKGYDIPDWVLPLGLVLMTIDFGWRFVRWVRVKRAEGKLPVA